MPLRFRGDAQRCVRARRRGGLATSLFAALTAVAGCEDNTFVPPPPPEVGVSAPIVRDVVRYADLSGRTEAFQVVEVRARVEGILLESLAAPGSRVEAGQTLFRIDPDLFIAERDAAAARVRRAEAELGVAEVRLDRVRRAAEQRAANELEVLEAEAAVDKAAADAEVARRELAIKQLSVDHTEVRAPISGDVEAGAPDVGSLVGRQGAEPLTRIFDTSRALVWMTVADRVFLQSASRGSAASGTPEYPVRIATEEDDGFPREGVIDYVDPAADPATGTVRFRATVENTDGALKPGLFVRGRIVAGEIPGALLVPEAAIGSGQVGRYVLVVGEDGVVEARPVTLGPREGDLRVIASGVDADDRVVVRGLLLARPGQRVAAVDAPIDPAGAVEP